MKDIILGGISILVAILLVALAGELGIRGMHLYAEHFGDRKPPHFTLDEKLGWIATPDYFYEGELVDASGTRYSVSIQTNAEGYRVYGDPRVTDRKKVLFLGDSYTQAMQVSNDKAYYTLLQNKLNLEVFAFGVDGFGTLQQLMLLDEIIDDIQPDAVVLQLCPNDLINNDYALETRSGFNNNGLRRPYLENGDIVYRNPANMPALREFAASYSDFLYFLITRLDRLRSMPNNPSESIIQEQGLSYPLFENSVATTDELLARIRSRIPSGTPLYTFSTSHGHPYLDVFRRVSDREGVYFIDGTSQALREIEGRGVTTRAADGEHWNDEGHRIVAEVLGRHFEELL